MRLPFAQLFTALPDGSFSPVRKARIRGIDLKPGLWIGDGVQIFDLDLATLRGREFEVDLQQGVAVVKAAY